ncbi:hypothetical protein RUM43_001632 [Polyplax serrata]|uniref:Peptidase S1 domain-containing protein n=1 Tax=Polyplax serrata TaxID=468196 RepID=A0AAN8XSG7_POLSC
MAKKFPQTTTTSPHHKLTYPEAQVRAIQYSELFSLATMLVVLFLLLSIFGGFSHGGQVSFPTGETTAQSNRSSRSSLERPEGTNSQVLDSLVSNRLKTKVASGTYETSGVSFPSDGSTMAETFPTLDHDVGISITSADYYPAGPIDPTFDTFQHVPILQAIVPQKMCDCMPLELCVNQSTLNVITTRVVTRPPLDTVCLTGHVYCCVENTKLGCGIPNVIPGVNPKEGQANLGQYPWSVIILTEENAYVGGGVLIDDRHILTVAHRVVQYGATSGLKVRLGDWDIMHDTEPVRYLEVKVSKVNNHPQFDSKTLRNDLSVITLESSVSTLTKPYPQINSICLPDFTMIFTGMRCKVAGWGKDQFDGNYQNIIKEVEVPVLSSMNCQSKLRNTKLGSSFVLDTDSFLCAGGEPGKDACTGDGGNALACMKDGKYYVAGLTAAGLGCGNSNTPGLYVNLVNYISWIKAVIKGQGETVINPRGGKLRCALSNP